MRYRSPLNDVLWSDFVQLQLSAKLPRSGERWIPIAAAVDTADLVPPHMYIDRCIQRKESRDVLATAADAAVVIEHNPGEGIKISVSAASDKSVAEILNDVESRIPKAKNTKNAVAISVWYEGQRGPRQMTKNIRTRTWREIARNYPVGVAEPLAELMGVTRRRGYRKLILWHGEPGTGKTTALRALIHSWRRWCSTDYVADPERLFASTEYLLEVIGKTNGPEARKASRWRLVIAEDSDEFLRVSARREAGAALGRLLNLSDGILGQGSNTIVLLTTNERLDTLHPALVRPGRCLAQIEFKSFSPGEAAEWLPAGIRRPTGATTLAELIEMSQRVHRITNGIAPLTSIGNYL